MKLTLHLTGRCDLDCDYCPADKSGGRMAEKTLYAACDFAFSIGKTAGLCFFGGEPLLEKELIYKAVERCGKLSRRTGKPAEFRMTTNGTHLDTGFLSMAKSCGMVIGLSFDGLMQDVSRKRPDGSGTFDTVSSNAKLLISEMPESVAMMTVSPKTAGMYAESVRYIASLGFRNISATIAYGSRVRWTEKDISVLRAELEKIAEFCSAGIVHSPRPVMFAPLDCRIMGLIYGKNASSQCSFLSGQLTSDVNGDIYRCTQFIGDERHYLGNVFDGIDIKRQYDLMKQVRVPEQCRSCDMRERCSNICGCNNRLETGDENKVSPLICTYERMLTEIADLTARKLCRDHREEFVRRYGAPIPGITE